MPGEGSGESDHESDRSGFDPLRAAVHEAANMTIVRTPDPAATVGRIRARRRRRAMLEVAGAVTAIGVVTAAMSNLAGTSGEVNPSAANGPTTTASQAVQTAAAATTPGSTIGQPDRQGVVCGQTFAAQYVQQGPAGLTVTVTAVHANGPSAMPDVDIAVTADQKVQISGPPRQLGIQVVVVHDGLVVDRIGGALWPEDYQPKPGENGQGAAARIWPVEVGKPHVEKLTHSHWTACPGADWRAILADQTSYRLVAIMPMPTVYGPSGPLAGASDALLGASVPLHAG